ncbi:hypothetical protein J2R96_005859 [Bradyrhizobium elkanii]|nr:hypothetical protein [Bradyrhizobium elkanii]
MEQDLHVLAQSGSDEVTPTALCRDKQSALDALTNIAGSAKKNGVGPVSIGTVGNIADHLTEIASIYRSAFLSNARSFPYLVR